MQIVINIDDRIFKRFREYLKSRKGRLQMVTLAIGIPLALHAAPVTIPNTFVANTVVSSAAMNANFAAVATAVNDNNTRITALQAVKTGYATAAAVTGVPRYSTTSISQNALLGDVGIMSVAGGNDYVLCPIQIPNGATITQISYKIYDNDVTLNSTAWLYRSDQAIVSMVSSTGASTTAGWVSSGALNHIVNNTLGGYYVYMQVDSASGANLSPIAFRATYTYTN